MTTKKPKLTLVKPADTAGPPRPLGPHGTALWCSVTQDYDMSDAGGREMLALACQSLDRAEALRAQIDADGEIARTKAGPKDHPGLKHEIAARSFVVRTLARLSKAGFAMTEVKAARVQVMAPKVATPVGRPSEKVENFHHSDAGKTRDKNGGGPGVRLKRKGKRK